MKTKSQIPPAVMAELKQLNAKNAKIANDHDQGVFEQIISTTDDAKLTKINSDSLVWWSNHYKEIEQQRAKVFAKHGVVDPFVK